MNCFTEKGGIVCFTKFRFYEWMYLQKSVKGILQSMTLFNNQLEYFFIFKVKDDSVKIGKDPYTPVVLLEGPSYTANLNLLIFI